MGGEPFREPCNRRCLAAMGRKVLEIVRGILSLKYLRNTQVDVQERSGYLELKGKGSGLHKQIWKLSAY